MMLEEMLNLGKIPYAVEDGGAVSVLLTDNYRMRITSQTIGWLAELIDPDGEILAAATHWTLDGVLKHVMNQLGR